MKAAWKIHFQVLGADNLWLKELNHRSNRYKQSIQLELINFSEENVLAENTDWIHAVVNRGRMKQS